LPHEFVHSWNGKYRRPAGLATPAYDEPVKSDMLWVYEGLTTYLASVLTARSGLLTNQDVREQMALGAAMLDQRPGRLWRPLVDTAVSAQLLFGAPAAWTSWRRSVDFYGEGALVWLEADTLIRRETRGQRSLDDFCRAFYGGRSGPPAVAAYEFEDVVSALNSVAPHDWRAFLDARLNRTGRGAPLGGIEASGWKIAYTAEPNGFLGDPDEGGKLTDFSYSIGLRLSDDGTVTDSVRGMPSEEAGIAPGMKVVAVNGRRWTAEVMRDAVKASRNGSPQLELLVLNGDYYRTCRLAYRGGEKYPHLGRDDSKPDLLAEIFKPRAAK
jgi:predicted metalloprotease with PDZ domain